MIKELKPFKGEIWKKNVWEKIAENLDFEQHSNFISVHSKSTFAQDFRVLIPPSPLGRPCSFSSTPTPSQGTFILGRTLPPQPQFLYL